MGKPLKKHMEFEIQTLTFFAAEFVNETKCECPTTRSGGKRLDGLQCFHCRVKMFVMASPFTYLYNNNMKEEIDDWISSSRPKEFPWSS